MYMPPPSDCPHSHCSDAIREQGPFTAQCCRAESRTYLAGTRSANVPGKDDCLALGGIVEKDEPAGLAVDWDVSKANPVLG